MKKEQEQRDLQAKLEVLLKKNFKALTNFEGVTSAGVGFRIKDGAYTDEICLYVEVSKKLPPGEISKEQVIPSSIEGVHVDIVEKTVPEPVVLYGKPEELDKYEIVSPLEGGIVVTNGKQDGNGNIAYGTLGAMAHFPISSNQFNGIISNNHVLYANGGTNGLAIWTQGIKPGQPYLIAHNYEGRSAGTEMDLAVASIDGNVPYTNKVKDIGTLTGFDEPFVGEQVRKYGITTNLTNGEITKVGVFCDGNACVYTGLEIVAVTIIDGKPVKTPWNKFCDNGDSGSVVVGTGVNTLVVGGLIWARSINDPNINITYANDIRRLLQLAGAFQIPAPGAQQMQEALTRSIKRLEKYKKQLSQSAKGREILAVFAENIEECTQLTHHHRESMVTWIKSKGPEFISLPSGLEESEPFSLKKEIDGIKIEEMMNKMSAIFQKYGTTKLSDAVQRFTPVLTELACRYDTVEDMVAAIIGHSEVVE